MQRGWLRLGAAAAAAPALTWLLASPLGRDLVAVVIVAALVPALVALVLTRAAIGQHYLVTGLTAVAGTVGALTVMSVAVGSEVTPGLAVVLVLAIYAVPGVAGLAAVASGARAWRAVRS